MRIKSLYECCIHTLAHNPRYINLTILPQEIIDGFINAVYAAKKRAKKVVITRPHGILLAAKAFPNQYIGIAGICSGSYNSVSTELIARGVNTTDAIISYYLLTKSSSIYYRYIWDRNKHASHGRKIYSDNEINTYLSMIKYNTPDDPEDCVIIPIDNIPIDILKYGCENKLFTIEYADIDAYY